MARSAASVLLTAFLLGAAPAGAVPAFRPAPVHPLPAQLLHLAAKADNPPPPDDDRGCDILSYDLDLRLMPGTRTMTGRAAIGFTPLAAGLDTLRLDFVTALTVDQVTRAGAPVPWLHGDESLRIVLDPPPAAGLPDTVVVTWHGTPPAHGPFNAGLMFRTHDNGTRLDRSDDVPVIANVSEPWSAHAWWPCKDLPADKAQVSLTAVLPDTLAMMGNGTLLAVTDAEPGWRRWAWREAWPIAPYLVSVAASRYTGWDEPCAPAVGGPVPLEFRVFPLDSLKAAHDFAPTCAMMDLMTRVAGPWPFPDEKYAQAEIVWIGAMEHQTATSFAQFLLTGDGRFQTFVIHEMAHQWFGDSLTPAAWRDIWLNEGFARYCEALWVEQEGGPGAYRDFMLQLGARRHEDLFTEQGLLGDPDPVLPNLLVYDKGAWLLHSLRQLIGDEAFFACLADYAGDPALVHGNVTSADFRAAAERAAGRDLGAFFAGWLASPAVVDLAADWTVAPGSGGSSRLALTLQQRQDPVIPVAVPVAIATDLGELRRTAVLDSRQATFNWTLPAPVTRVTIDPDSTVLMTRAGPVVPPLAVTGPVPNPVLAAAGADFTVTPRTGGPVTVRVFDARGRLLDRRDLGTLPAGEDFPWTWTPDPAGGGHLASGVVWLEFRGGGGRAVRRAVLLR